ncbi:MAG: GAF domain-containing protein, partial [SAR202 cluster bacterium]|nr:GAF domain-containing protein [SAR202 cluster bacterium]
TLFQFIVRQRRGLVLGTDADDQAAARHPVQLQFVAMNLPSLVAVPLVHQDRVVGILELRSKHLKAYGQIELGLLHKMASIIAPGAYDSRIGVVRRKPAVVRRVVLSDKPVERAPQLAVPKAAPPEPSPQSADEPQEQIEQQKPEIGTPTDDAPRNIVKVSPSIEPALSEVKRPADDDPDVVPRVVQRQSMLDDDEVFEVLEEIKRTVTADTRGRDDDDEEEVTRQPVRVPLGSRDDEELDDLRREVRESKAEAEIARAAATARSMEDTFSAAAKHLADVISVDSLHLFTLDESKERLAADYLLGTDIDGWERGRYIPVEGSFFETTVRSQSHYLAAADSSVDLAEMHPPLTSAAAAGLASILVVPLVHQSQAVGVIALGSRLPIAYQQRHIDFLNRIAPVLSNAVVEANEADATKRQSEQEAALRRISAGLTSILKAEEVYQRLADGIAKLVRFDRLVVNEIDHEEKDLVRVFAAGVDIPKTILGGRQPIQGSTAAEVLSTRAPVLVSGLSDADLKRRFPAMAPAVEMGLKSLITAPIIVEDRVIATLHLFSKDARGYKQADAVLAGRVANLAAPAIANARTRAAILEAEKRAAEEAAAKAEDPMLEIGRVVWTVPDIQSMYEQVGEYVQELIPFDRFAVWTVDVERGALVNTFVAAMEDGQVTRVEPVAAQRSTARLALTRAAGNGNRDDADSAGRLEQLASGIADGLPGLILVPLFYENEGVGMLSFASHEEDTFTPEHEELAEAVGQLMAARVGLEQISIRRAFTAHHMRQQLEQMGVEVAERTRELDTVKSELEILKSTVDHDLRQPLDTIEDVIDAVLESLAQGKSKDSRTQLLRVRAASRVAAQQLNVLAQMSEVANRSMAVERIDLTGLARTVSKKVRDANPGQSVTVSVGKELSVEADRYLLEVLFGSLLTQAWNRASGASKPRIQIGASTSDGRLVFYMKDNGKAVGSAAAEAMFTENSGMANSLARRVVARHNGRIWAESES